jgi:predicted nuclease of predicted toxin-antitoxin system
MKIWIDAQLPPTLANWLSATFDLEASALRDKSLQDAQTPAFCLLPTAFFTHR